MAQSAVEDDAASQALIAQLIAEDWDSNQNTCPIGRSVEDCEDPLSSYERGLIDDPDNVNNGPDGLAAWGDPLVTGANEGSPSTDASHGEATSEGWDASVADCFDIGTPDTATSEHGDQGGPQVLQGSQVLLGIYPWYGAHGLQGAYALYGAYGSQRPRRIASHHLSDELYEQLDTERLALARTVSLPDLVRRQSVERPRRTSDLESITANIASPPTESDAPPRTEYIGHIMPAGTQVLSRPATPVDSRRKGSDPPRLETPSQTSNPPSPTPRPTHVVYISDDSNPPSPTPQSTHMVHIPDEPKPPERSKTEQPVGEPKENVPDVEAKVANTGSPPTQPDSPPRKEHIGYHIGPAGAPLSPPPRLTRDEGVSRPVFWQRPTRFDTIGKPIEWSAADPIHRPSAFDHHTGLDVDFSYSNGKDKKGAFDEFDEHKRDGVDYNEGYEALRKENLERGLDLGDDEGEGSCSPWIYIPFLGRCGEGLGEIDARTEDNEVVEIRLDDDDSRESILSDIANTKSPDGIDSTSLSGTQSSAVQGELDQGSAFKRVRAPKNMRARENAWARHNQGLPQLPGDQELMDDESEDAGYEVSEQVLKLSHDKAGKDVGTREGKPGKAHKSQRGRGRNTQARVRWIKGWPLEPGDKKNLDAKPLGWRRTWGYNKDLVQEGFPRQRPVKVEEVNSLDKLRQVGDDEDKADGEHDDALKEKGEQREEQPKDDEVIRGTSSTREEHTAMRKRVDTNDETSKGWHRVERKRKNRSSKRSGR